jgi:SprT protein
MISTMDAMTLQNDVIKKTHEFWQQAQSVFKFNNGVPKIEWHLKGRVAGQARGTNWINVNMALLSANKETYLNQTIPHELCHCIDDILYGSKTLPHGRTWKYIMRTMGIAPKRCHNYNLEGIVTTYNYKCSCRTWQFSKHRHTKVLKGKFYRCLNCNERIVKV